MAQTSGTHRQSRIEVNAKRPQAGSILTLVRHVGMEPDVSAQHGHLSAKDRHLIDWDELLPAPSRPLIQVFLLEKEAAVEAGVEDDRETRRVRMEDALSLATDTDGQHDLIGENRDGASRDRHRGHPIEER